MVLTRRDLWKMVILMILTLGLYVIYWFYKTKHQINALGGEIPTTLLFFIPLVNFYYLYRFAEDFCRVVLKDESQFMGYFLVLALLMPVGVLIFQSKINDRVRGSGG